MRCLVAESGASYDWHFHAFEEFTLVTEDRALIGFAGKKHVLEPNTLCLYRRGEPHGGWCPPGHAHRSWVVHFSGSEEFYRQVDLLAQPNPLRRIWALSAEQAKEFRWFFLQILTERTKHQEHNIMAESAWLRLLLILVHRWAKGETPANLPPAEIQPEVSRLWHLVNSSVGKPEEFVKQIHQIPNYDSLRHAFRKAFGCSPRDLMQSLRIQQAKNLLLETSLSVKEISLRLGYPRQHEFTRAFHQQVGVAPSSWRSDPIRSTVVV
jgi:AraC-like DNA-binding protein